MTDSALIEMTDVHVGFGARRVLDGVSCQLARGECVGLVGENGAGKSTLLRILVGLLQPASGRVTRRGRIGYCPQEPLVFDGLTIDENFEYFASAYGCSPSRWRAAADALAERLEFTRDRCRVVSALSGGTRQKLNLAVALLADPDVLILDEPYAGFDWETYLRFWQMAADLRSQGRSVLIVSHLVYERQRFDRLLQLHGGQLGPAAATS
jgi:ABC-2 type transport system ATP-binding protein